MIFIEDGEESLEIISGGTCRRAVALCWQPHWSLWTRVNMVDPWKLHSTVMTKGDAIEFLEQDPYRWLPDKGMDKSA